MEGKRGNRNKEEEEEEGACSENSLLYSKLKEKQNLLLKTRLPG
jgi:hypothetical protein